MSRWRACSRIPLVFKTGPKPVHWESVMTKGLKNLFGAGVAVAALLTGMVAAQAGSLKIESWRTDDTDIWTSKIIPAFNKHYPDIKVEFSATAPKEYDAALGARLTGGTAGDLITCRPFDKSLDLYNKKNIDSLNDL